VIVHILIGKMRDDLSAAEEQELSEALWSLRDLPQVAGLSWGPDFSGRSKGYTHGAVVYFENRDKLKAYQRDERHLKVVETLNRLMPDRLVVDYETETSGISA
jgi:hypothetical protein